MRIGIVGSGMIGGVLAPLLSDLGHDVHVANRRGPESLQHIVADHPALTADTVDGAIAHGEVIVLAIPFRSYREFDAGKFAGKTVVDATNYYPDRDGHFPELDRGTTTSSELVADHLRQATVVKAFNTIYFAEIRGDARPGGDPKQRRALPIAGDDGVAVERVSVLIDQLGFTPVRNGSLADGARQQPGSPVYNVALTESELRAALDAA
jgi:predicted dinucleotide-binding enzyme